MLLLSMGGVTLAASTASAEHGGGNATHDNNGNVGGGQGGTVHKSYVCKYVRTPGGDEELLQTGQNPIWVDNHSLVGKNVPVNVGDEFQDAHIRSVVIVANTVKLDPEPGVDACPGGDDGPDDTVDVSVSPTGVCVGQQIVFTLTNAGTDTTSYTGQLTTPGGVTTSLGTHQLGGGASKTFPHTATVAGTYTAKFWVAGNTAVFDTATATASDCANPQVDVSVSPTSVCVGQQVVFTLKNSGSDSTAYVGEFTAPGAAPTSLGPVTIAGGASQTFTYTANTAGSYTVKFWVEGNTAVTDTATATARVCPDLPERPDALVDRDVEVRETCPGGVERRTLTVTTEYVWNGTAWVLGTPGAAVVSDWVKVRDLTAAERDELDCDEVLPTEAVDVCPNIPGTQKNVPKGMKIIDGECEEPEVLGTETSSPTPGVTPVVNPPLPPQGLPTAVDAGFGPTDSGSGSMTAVMAQLMMGAGLLFLIAAGWLQRGHQNRGVHQF